MDTATKHFRKRDAILSYLCSTDTHPSAETIYAELKPQIPNLAMGTVYRNLTLFKQQGLVSGIATVNGVERFDANTDPHVHFICNDCHAVVDLHEMQVPQTLSQAAGSSIGGQVTECHLSFSGLCRNCLNQKRKRGEIL